MCACVCRIIRNALSKHYTAYNVPLLFHIILHCTAMLMIIMKTMCMFVCNVACGFTPHS